MSLDRVTAAIVSAARTIHHAETSVDATLEAIAVAARDSIPGFNLVGISTVDHRGHAVTRAVTDPMVQKFDDLQYSLDQGPCLDALGAAHVVSVPHIRHEQRWPRYVPEVVQLGLRSQLAVKLALDDYGTLGGVNLYSTISDDIEPEAESIAELFAIHATSTLGSVTKIEQLNQAMHTRKVIGQAIGILMERYSLNEDRAFAFLVRASQTDNIKLRDIAQELVDLGNTHHAPDRTTPREWTEQSRQVRRATCGADEGSTARSRHVPATSRAISERACAGTRRRAMCGLLHREPCDVTRDGRAPRE